MSDADVLLRLAGAIADGDRVEWPSVLGSLRDPHNHAVARSLEAIARESADSLSLTHALRPVQPALPVWARLVVTVGLVHVVLGLAAYVLGRVSPLAFLPGARILTATALGACGAILYLGGRDERARWLGAIFAALASGAALSMARLVPLWPGAPTGEAAPWAIPLPDCLMPWLLWSFAERFPAVVRFNRLERVLALGARLSLALGLVLALANLWATLGLSTVAQTVLRRNNQGLFWVLSFAGSVVPLLLMLLRVRYAPEDERRRFRWFAAGLGLGLGPLLIVVAADALSDSVRRWLDRPGASEAVGLLLFACELTLPVTVGYAVVARRIMDVRVVVRRALQRALARSSLAVFTLLPGSLLVFILWRERARPIGDVLGGGAGLAMGMLLLTTILLVIGQRPAAAFVDRLFEQEAADRSLCLARLVRLVQTAETAEEAMLGLGEIACTALGCSSSVLLLAEPPLLRPIPGSTGRPLPIDSAVFAVLQGERAGMIVGPEEPRTLFAWLPESERQWIIDSRVALLTPVRDGSGALVAAVGFGGRRSGPYADADVHFVAAATEALGSAFPRLAQRSGGRPQSEDDAPARECRACAAVIRAAAECPECGGHTVEASLPKLVNGKYAVQRVLGRGGMGVVYLGEDLALRRPVALKTLPRASAHALVRLREEARAMASVTGSHLATIHALESWRGIPILAVEYLAGGTLADRAKTPLPWSEVRGVALAMGRALQDMHGQGLLHGDVKPSNIGFTRDGTAKLLDFGLSRLARGVDAGGAAAEAAGAAGAESSASSQSGRLMGTILYLSPERLAGARPSEADDVWALAVTCLECLVGRHPLRSSEGVRGGHVPGLLAEALLAIGPPVARATLERALSSDARGRFATAAQFVRHVEESPK